MAVNDAEQIFVSLPTADDPHKKVTLQDAVALLVCEVLDLKTEISQLRQWAGLTDELGKSVERMTQTFDKLSATLHGTTQVAKAIMTGKPPSKGNVN